MVMNKQMQILINKIKEADKAYYEDNNPIMSDFEYDKLMDELINLEKLTRLTLPDSPTKKVSGRADGNFEKFTHTYPMLSLNKTKSATELVDFLGSEDGILSYKLDGLTMVAYYEDGKLKRLVTRGNGIVGEDVTRNIKLFKHIPKEVSDKGDFIVRGEAVMSYSEFNKINESEEEAYKNPRNLASGLLRSKELKYEGVLNFLAYSIENYNEHNYNEQLKHLKEEGFDVVTTYKDFISKELCNIDNAMKVMTPENTDFPVDGLVLRMNNYKKVKELGSTSKFPRFAMAFKWKDEVVETKMKDILWSVARTGVITPVAIFEPVEIEGTTVERASLHNLSTFKEFKLGAGDRVTVYKANMIIPQILENLDKTNTFKSPVKCPSCGHEVQQIPGKLDGVINLVCTNDNCLAKNISSLELFVSKDGFDIEGLSEKTLELLVDNGLIKEYKDIFRLKEHKETIVKLPLFGEKSYNNLITAIEKSKNISANKFLRSLGISLVGNSLTADIFKDRNNKETLVEVLNADKDSLMSKFGFGDKASDNLIQYVSINRGMVNELLEIVNIISIANKASDNSLDGKSFCITGKLNTISRKELENLIKDKGGKIQSAVTSNTDYLVNNDVNSTSSKNKKAKELGKPIVDEEEVLRIINNN